MNVRLIYPDGREETLDNETSAMLIELSAEAGMHPEEYLLKVVLPAGIADIRARDLLQRHGLLKR